MRYLQLLSTLSLTRSKNRIKFFWGFTLVLLPLFFFGCSQNEGCENGLKGTLVDMAGLDGCSWLIELENGDRLQPVNFGDFTIGKVDGLAVTLTYQEKADVAGICMSGKMVELTCLKTDPTAKIKDSN